METTPQLRRMIHRAAASHELREEARRGGFLTLREEGVLISIAGKASLEEVLSVTHNEDAGGKETVKPKAPESATVPSVGLEAA